MAKGLRSKNWQPPMVMEVDSDKEEVVERSRDVAVQVEDNPNKPA